MRLAFPVRLAIATACTATAMAMLAGSAGAVVFAAEGPDAFLELRGSHGYRLEAFAAKGFGVVALQPPENRGGLGSSAEYAVFDAKVTDKRVKIDLRGRGRISALFKPTGRVRRFQPPGNCKGGPETIRFGTFVGKIRFRGERGYTTVRATRARGAIRRQSRLVCKSPKRKGKRKQRHKKARKGPLATIFSAGDAATGTAFTAFRSSDDPRSALFAATSFEQREGVSISRQALVIGGAARFDFDAGLNSAQIEPPAPFAGSAHFERIDDHASRWEGPLTVSLPGAPDTPLTGRNFAWALWSERLASSSSATFSFYARPSPLDRPWIARARR